MFIVASEHVDPEGSVVKSGIVLADATLRALEENDTVTISLKGLKGASSSYFNVFLRRIEEECGLAEIEDHIHLEFGSKIQEMVFQRSFASRGPRMPPSQPSISTSDVGENRQTVWKWILRAFGARNAG